jgi:branched-subunit amino acid ABC-type transport system permease component
MTDFLQFFFSGLATGAIYALAALGFTLLWQASGTINFAQGEFVMLPAFMMLAFGAGACRCSWPFCWPAWWRWSCWAGPSSAAWWTRCSSTA